MMETHVIEDTMDQLQEHYDQQQELHDASTHVFGDNVHDDVLLEDLQAMRGQHAPPTNGPATQPLQLPQAPQHAPKPKNIVVSQAAKELQDMEAMMG